MRTLLPDLSTIVMSRLGTILCEDLTLMVSSGLTSVTMPRTSKLNEFQCISKIPIQLTNYRVFFYTFQLRKLQEIELNLRNNGFVFALEIVSDTMKPPKIRWTNGNSFRLSFQNNLVFIGKVRKLLLRDLHARFG
jgi:hypothetical protein